MAEIDLLSILNENTIDLSEKEFANKDELFRYMSELFYKAGFIKDVDDFIKALEEREETGSTYMGMGLAVPHGKSETVNKASAAIVRCKEFDYVSNNDHGPINICTMLAIPSEAESDSYVRLLGNFTRLLVHEEFMNALQTSKDAKELVKIGEESIAKLS